MFRYKADLNCNKFKVTKVIFLFFSYEVQRTTSNLVIKIFLHLFLCE